MTRTARRGHAVMAPMHLRRLAPLTLLSLIAFTTTSYAGAGKTCAKVCRKVSSCKILSFDLCMDMCDQQGAEDTPESRASNLAQAKLSCSALANQAAPSEWLCTAEGTSSYGHGMDGSLPDEQGSQDLHLLGNGKTRSAAAYKALNACNTLMTVQLNNQRSMRDDGDWGAEITTECHITQCIAPTSTRKSKRQK
jgi:hypothetical protein